MEAWGTAETQFFFSLTPDMILNEVEFALGKRCTGRCMPLNSMENRVYEIEIDQEPTQFRWQSFVIAKFYRPGRWSRQQIEEEHSFLADLQEADIPVIAPLTLQGGGTCQKLKEADIFFALFPKTSGRSPQELTSEQFQQIGRLIARLHMVGAGRSMQHRITLNTSSFGHDNLDFLVEKDCLPVTIKSNYVETVTALLSELSTKLDSASGIRIHGDAHLGNLLWGDFGPFWVDFDDCLMGPAVQDLWLLAGGRDQHSQQNMRDLLQGYEMMGHFDRSSLTLIEGLRGLRLLHFAAWIAKRWQDPAFSRAFPTFGTDSYWSEQLTNMQEQLALVRQPHIWQSLC